MPSLNRKDGYLMVDHRFSPGLPEEVARASGYDPTHCREGKVFEAATMYCTHCGITLVKNPLRQRDRAYCKKCDHYICDPCDIDRRQPSYQHLPYRKLQELVLNLAEHGGQEIGSPQALLRPTIVVP